MKYNYANRLSYLINLQSNCACEILSDITEENARLLLFHLTKTKLQLLTIIPNKVCNVNNISFFGIDRGKTLHAIAEGFSDQEIGENINNMIELEDEANAVNFICGDMYFRKNEKCIQQLDKILEKIA